MNENLKAFLELISEPYKLIYWEVDGTGNFLLGFRPEWHPHPVVIRYVDAELQGLTADQFITKLLADVEKAHKMLSETEPEKTE